MHVRSSLPQDLKHSRQLQAQPSLKHENKWQKAGLAKRGVLMRVVTKLKKRQSSKKSCWQSLKKAGMDIPRVSSVSVLSCPWSTVTRSTGSIRSSGRDSEG
jgi:hypothetical protein